MVQKPQHEDDATNDPGQLEHGDFVPARGHARQPRGGAFERGAEGGEGFALWMVRMVRRRGLVGGTQRVFWGWAFWGWVGEAKWEGRREEGERR